MIPCEEEPDIQLNTAKSGPFRRTPPAIFPPIFGLFGLALAWRRATDGFAVSSAMGDIILGGVTMLYLFALTAYAVKFTYRPGVVVDDLKTLPGRAGLVAMVLSGMLLAAGVVTFSTTLALLILILAVGLHAGIAVLVTRELITGPAKARRITPVWHLIFVGLILSPLAALPLGFANYSLVIFAVMLVLALAIWGASLGQIISGNTPAPLRPILAIHLAPASMLGTVAYMLGFAGLGFALGILAIVILAWLLIRVRWLTETGFSPLWGAFTFPLAAFSTCMQIMGAAGHGLWQGEVFRVLGGLTLVAATMIIPVITWKILQLWAKGALAVKTNAAEA